MSVTQVPFPFPMTVVLKVIGVHCQWCDTHEIQGKPRESLGIS